MTKKERATFWLKPNNKAIVAAAADNQNKLRPRRKKWSQGEILDALIEQHLGDPIKEVEKQRRHHIEMLKILSDRIQDLKKYRDDDVE